MRAILTILLLLIAGHVSAATRYQQCVTLSEITRDVFVMKRNGASKAIVREQLIAIGLKEISDLLIADAFAFGDDHPSYYVKNTILKECLESVNR